MDVSTSTVSSHGEILQYYDDLTVGGLWCGAVTDLARETEKLLDMGRKFYIPNMEDPVALATAAVGLLDKLVAFFESLQCGLPPDGNP
jgi:hypothetical protein